MNTFQEQRTLMAINNDSNNSFTLHEVLFCKKIDAQNKTKKKYEPFLHLGWMLLGHNQV